MENEKILWLGYGGVHPAHRIFADAIGADVKNIELDAREGYHNAIRYALNGLKQREYDVIVANEGVAMRSAAALKTYSKLHPKMEEKTIIRYLANQNLFWVHEGKAKRPYSSKFMCRFADGAIANSQFTAKYGKKYIDGPVEYAYPAMEQGLYSSLNENSPDFHSVTMGSVGGCFPAKGKDILIRAFEKVRDSYSDSKLVLVGSGTKKYNHVSGVKSVGYQNDVAPFYEGLCVHIQPSRAEGFGVTVVEAARAGVPSVVTENMGAREVVEGIDPGLVAEANPESLAETIIDYLELSEERKLELSRDFREMSEDFSPEKQKPRFKENFSRVLETVESSS